MQQARRPDLKALGTETLFDVLGCILYGAGVYNFAYAAHFAPGGVSGLSVLLHVLTRGSAVFPEGIPIGLAMILINVPIVLVCFRALGAPFFLRSAKTILISALFVDHLMPRLWLYQGSQMLAALFGGLLAGAGLALIYLHDSSTGGTDFIILAIRKKHPHLSIGMISLAVDGIVILLGGIVFGTVDAALYGLVMTAAYSLMIDKILLGSDSRKLMTIVSEQGERISGRINAEISRGVTVICGRGAYTGGEKEILLCACSRAEVYRIKRLVFALDPGAFVMVSSIDAAFGEGFNENRGI